MEKQPLAVNLEGSLTFETPLDEKVLFNHVSILPALKAIGAEVVCLANNHICDLPNGVQTTVGYCQKEELQTIGAGKNLTEALKPVFIEEDGKKIIMLAWGWSTIQCVPAKKLRSETNPLNPKTILNEVTEIREKYPAHSI